MFLLKFVSQQAVLTRRLIESVGQTRVGKTANFFALVATAHCRFVAYASDWCIRR